MTTTSTYSFDPAASSLTLQAFERIGLRGTEVTIQHLSRAAIEANLLQASIASQTPNLWTSEVYEIVLEEGTAEYDLPDRLVAVQDAYISTVASGADASTAIDRVIYALSLSDYDAMPNKTIQAPPTAYLIRKVIPTPTITFWQVPDAAATYTAHIRILRRIQDASMTSGTTLDLPYTYLDVFVAGMAHRLARIYAPEKEALRKQDYLEALAIAQTVDTQDNTPIMIMPVMTGYWARR